MSKMTLIFQNYQKIVDALRKTLNYRYQTVASETTLNYQPLCRRLE